MMLPTQRALEQLWWFRFGASNPTVRGAGAAISKASEAYLLEIESSRRRYVSGIALVPAARGKQPKGFGAAVGAPPHRMAIVGVVLLIGFATSRTSPRAREARPRDAFGSPSAPAVAAEPATDDDGAVLASLERSLTALGTWALSFLTARYGNAGSFDLDPIRHAWLAFTQLSRSSPPLFSLAQRACDPLQLRQAGGAPSARPAKREPPGRSLFRIRLFALSLLCVPRCLSHASESQRMPAGSADGRLTAQTKPPFQSNGA